MVAKKIITKSIDDAINKCKPIYRASTINSFKKIADKNNLKILSDTDKNSFIELYDSKNKTKIIFTKDFINKNHIDLQDKNNKNINITELFEGYFDLPLKNKQDMNELLYTVDNSRKEEGVKAWTHLLTEDGHHHRVTIPDYVFEIDNPDNTNNYPYIMAHESMHAHDFIKLSEEQINHPEENKYLISNEDSYRFSAPYFNEDNYLVDTDYLKSVDVNDNYIGWLYGGGWNNNKSSDYGSTDRHEDYAECGAMIITGYHNPNNPNSVTIKNNAPIQFREWIKSQPFKAQNMIKELYDEDVSIKELLDMASWKPGEYKEFMDRYNEANSRGWLPDNLKDIL